MLYIDGLYGEGGGQILRNAVAFSILTKNPIEIKNIRAKRSNPGIQPQHYAAISIMKKLCNAETENLEIGSSHLKFIPKKLQEGKYAFDIGTAGSIPLVFQACILSALQSKKTISIKLVGGTDVRWSPSWDYFTHVFLPLIGKMGIIVNTKLIKRGYYPKGGGEAIITINPYKKIIPLQINEKQEVTDIKGIINIANLPEHIGKRMKHEVIKILSKKNLDVSITIERTTALSAGVGITLWSDLDNTVLGSTVLGEKGIPAEKIAEDASFQLLKEIDTGATLDIYAVDQVLPYMALAGENGESFCIINKLTNHAETNMWLIKQFFDVEFNIIQYKNAKKLSIKQI